MMPGPALPPGGDGLDARLRRAMRQAAEAWVPADRADARLAMLAAAGRRARRRRHAWLAGGSLVVLAAAGTLAGSASTPTGGHAGSARAMAGAQAGARASGQAGGRVPAAGGAAAVPTRVGSSPPPCVRVAAGSGAGSCAGVLVAVGASGASAPRAQAATGSTAAAAGPGDHGSAAPAFGQANGSAPARQGASGGPTRSEATPADIVADVEGRSLAVRLPLLPGMVWGEPSVGGAGPTAGAVSGGGAAPGSVRVVAVARDPAAGVRSFDLVGTHPGLVQVEVTGRTACASAAGGCGTAAWRWTVDVLVSARPVAGAQVP